MWCGSWGVSRCGSGNHGSSFPDCFSFLSEVGKRSSPENENGKRGVPGKEKRIWCKLIIQKSK